MPLKITNIKDRKHSHGSGTGADPRDHAHQNHEGHNHSHDFRSMEKSRLVLALTITAVMFIIELVGGVWSNSLALISDAGHMFTHIIALGTSFIAIKFAEKEKTDKMTFGFHRAEILAAFVNGATLLLLTVWVAYEAYNRFWEPRLIDSLSMFWIALAGLVINVVTAVILKDASHRSINIKSAFLHLLGDTFSSVGVVAGAIIIYFKGWNFVDPIISILICIPIIIWSYSLLMESIDVLLEAAPKGIDVAEVGEAIRSIELVSGIHDIHVWTLTSGTFAMSAHVEVNDVHLSETTSILANINDILKNRFKIEHNTIQLECGDKCVAACNFSLNDRSNK